MLRCKVNTDRSNSEKRDLLEPTNSHQSGQLSGDDVERGTCHKAADSGRGNEFNQPAKVEKADPKDDEAANERDRGGNLGSIPRIGMRFVYVLDDLGDRERHHSDGTDGYILRSGEELAKSGQ